VVVFWGGELVSSPLLSCSPCRRGMPRRASLLPHWGRFNGIRLLIILPFFIVLVIRLLESPGELLASTGSLPLPQSSRWGQRR
jgi:hypothetical protein